MSSKKTKVIGAAELLLLLLLLLQGALVVLFTVPQFSGKLAVSLINSGEYTAATKLISSQNIKGSADISSWVKKELSGELDTAADTGGERSQKVMDLARTLDSKGYDCTEALEEAFDHQRENGNYMDNGGVSAVSILNVLSGSEDYFDLTELVTEAEQYEHTVLLDMINNYRKQNGYSPLKHIDRIDRACSELAVFILENVDDLNSENFRASFASLRKTVNTDVSTSYLPLQRYNFISYINSESTGLYISKGADVFDSFSTDQLIALLAKEHDYIGIGSAYDPENESFVWYIETIEAVDDSDTPN